MDNGCTPRWFPDAYLYSKCLPGPDLHEAATATSSAAITIQPQSYVVIVRDKDAMNNQGITFRSRCYL